MRCRFLIPLYFTLYLMLSNKNWTYGTIFSVCRTPLHLALSHANRKVFDLILESPSSLDLDSKNSEGHPPLWLALRSFEGTDDSSSNPFSDEPSAGSKVLEEMAESLVAKGASVNIVSALPQRSPHLSNL